jgi:hypothetical protein
MIGAAIVNVPVPSCWTIRSEFVAVEVVGTGEQEAATGECENVSTQGEGLTGTWVDLERVIRISTAQGSAARQQIIGGDDRSSDCAARQAVVTGVIRDGGDAARGSSGPITAISDARTKDCSGSGSGGRGRDVGCRRNGARRAHKGHIRGGDVQGSASNCRSEGAERQGHAAAPIVIDNQSAPAIATNRQITESLRGCP